MDATSSALRPPPVADPAPLFVPPECVPNYDEIVTEDDTPVDSLFAEREAKLLTDALYSSWIEPEQPRPFIAMSNVGLFYALRRPPIVPDFLLSLDVETPADVQPKQNRSYFVWNYGKAPEVVVEIVSNREGGEAEAKWLTYAKIGVPYYVIHDPWNELRAGELRVFGLQQGRYEPINASWLPEVGLGLTLWRGSYLGLEANWLRWCDHQGQMLPTGRERAEREQVRADLENQRADSEQHRADSEQLRADSEQHRADAAERRAAQLAEQLRVLGVTLGHE